METPDPQEQTSTREYHPINLDRSNLVVAVAQLTGPSPDGKKRAVINDRETLAWQSLDDMKARVEKTYAILDELAGHTVKPDLVVFPEYSFPVQRALAELQRKADDHGFIIFGGADSFWQPGTGIIYNQCPIIIPGRSKPLWVTKRRVSQWEEGLVDEPQHVVQPVLTWTAGARDYWIVPHICLDFALAADENKQGGGLFVVPMCSPDVIRFLGWADGLLGLRGGSATVLCNCVGEGAKGQSGVVAMNAGGKPFQAALELSATKEQVSIFEIDLARLSPPRRTDPAGKKFPLGRRYLYDLETNGGVQFQPVEVKGEDAKKRGIINPAIFSAVLGKKMRMAFLNVPQYGSVRRKMEGVEFEVLAILGKEDLMVTHLAADRYDMIFDVTQYIDWIGTDTRDPVTVTVKDLPGIDENNFPHFSVNKFYKVLGVKVGAEDRDIFNSKERPFPEFKDIEKIFKLGEHWEDPDVTDEERTRFTQNHWILGTTDASPGDINAVMAIKLEHTRRDNKQHLMATFEEKVVPELIGNSQVTSLYRGDSSGVSIDYVLRLSVELNGDSHFSSLYHFIEKVHDLSLEQRLKADTTTYIVVRRHARLSLPKAILVTNLSRDKAYRDHQIIPYLSREEWVRLTYQPSKEQLDYIDLFKPVDAALKRVAFLGLDGSAREVLLQRLARGLFNRDFEALKEVHDQAQSKVERLLSNFIRDYVCKDEFRGLKQEEKILPQKDKGQLNYTEKIRVVARHIDDTWRDEETLTAFIETHVTDEEFRLLKAKEGFPAGKERADLSGEEKARVVARHAKETSGLTSVKELHTTNKVRNAFAHADAEERLTLDEFVATMVTYCNFINIWKRG